jgi:hypothetical protein
MNEDYLSIIRSNVQKVKGNLRRMGMKIEGRIATISSPRKT